MRKDPIKVKEQDSQKRISNFDEVIYGYTEEEAVEEAKRCLQCKNPTCIQGCPVGINIKKFIYEIANRKFSDAYYTIREKNNFPSICGRVCPAEYQCRKSCVLTPKDEPFASSYSIQIHLLERFVGDWGIKNNLEYGINGFKKTNYSGIKVAVVGSGPAGLCCAGELGRKGIDVEIFEALHKPGGVLRYGIPSFRLPQDILDYEIDYLKKLNIKINLNTLIGKTFSLEDLLSQGFKAIFLGLGAGTPSLLNIPGENAGNIYSANEFLTRVNLMCAYKFPDYHTPINIGKKIVVIGGGNTAIDSARVAIRLQKISGLEPDTTIIYRRTELEMPARRIEIEHAKEEGIKFEFLVQPKEFLQDNMGRVCGIKLLKCRMGDKDLDGRRKFFVIENSDFVLPCDLVIVAIGFKPNRVLLDTTPGLSLNEDKTIKVDGATMATSLKGVFAGGDIVSGEGTVIASMGMAKKASLSIVKYLEEVK